MLLKDMTQTKEMPAANTRLVKTGQLWAT